MIKWTIGVNMNTKYYFFLRVSRRVIRFSNLAVVRRSTAAAASARRLMQYWANQLRGKCKHCPPFSEILLYGFWLGKLVTWLLYLISLAKTVVSQKALPSIHASVRFHDAVKYDFCMTSRPQYYLQLTHSDALVQLEVILLPCGCTKIIFDNIMAHDGCKNFRQRFLGNRGFSVTPLHPMATWCCLGAKSFTNG